MKKRYLATVFAVLLLFSTILSPSAAGIDNSPDVVSPTAHDVEYKRELVGEPKLFEKHPIGFASGQPANGTVFTSPGGFYWSDGGLLNSVDVSLGASWGIFSISVGSVGGTGRYIDAPTNTRCKLFIYKDIVCEKYANYERLRGSTGEWTFTGYENVAYVITEHLEIRYGDNFSSVWRG